jgi:hypothetical protein
MSESDLEPGDIVVIAGHALQNGYVRTLDPRTVDRYLRGMTTRERKRKAIERSMRELGWGAFVRKPSIAKTGAR